MPGLVTGRRTEVVSSQVAGLQGVSWPWRTWLRNGHEDHPNLGIAANERETPKRHSVRTTKGDTVSLTAAVNEEDVQYRQRRNAIGLSRSYSALSAWHLE
jgi:hypothetical protein